MSQVPHASVASSDPAPAAGRGIRIRMNAATDATAPDSIQTPSDFCSEDAPASAIVWGADEKAMDGVRYVECESLPGDGVDIYEEPRIGVAGSNRWDSRRGWGTVYLCADDKFIGQHVVPNEIQIRLISRSPHNRAGWVRATSEHAEGPHDIIYSGWATSEKRDI